MSTSQQKGLKTACALLTALIYLTVFLLHDVVIAAPRFPAPTDAPSCSDLQDIFTGVKHRSDYEHHCPFCAGFLDNHAEADAQPVAGGECDVLPMVSSHSSQERTFSHRPRDPPGQAI